MPTVGINPQALIDKLWERNKALGEQYLLKAPRYVHVNEITEGDLVLSLSQGHKQVALVVEPTPEYRLYVELAISLLGS